MDRQPQHTHFSEKKRFAAALIMLAVSGILSLCARTLPGFAHGYSVTVYAALKNAVGRFFGLFPVSLSELGLYALILLAVWDLAHHFRRPVKLLSDLFLTASCLLLIFTLNCGINYYRTPFSYEAGFSIKKSSAKELYELCEYLTEQVNASLKQLDTRELDLKKLGQQGQSAMTGLGALYPQLAGFYPYPKPLLNSWILSVQQLCGIYSPFTIEANYNGDMPYYNIPHTICHELSHLKGYMREDEANFIGYLACITSDSPDFRYSGYLTGWVYAGNALAKADMEGYIRLRKKLAPEAADDLAYNNFFWDQYEGKVAEAANQMNDTYLKVHSQTDGVKSYGRMVDLMLAYYGSNKK